jgi:hypothetical protein
MKLAQRGKHFLGHLHAGNLAKGQPKSRQQFWGFKAKFNTRISPPVDEYYIMQSEGVVSAWR